jgi:hypothetical protein
MSYCIVLVDLVLNLTIEVTRRHLILISRIFKIHKINQG